MSELQDALDSPTAMAQAFMTGFQLRGEAEGWPESTMIEIANVIEVLRSQSEAERLVADPNIDAAVASVFTKGGAGRSGQEWPVEMYPSDIARAVAAALTPGDPNE